MAEEPNTPPAPTERVATTVQDGDWDDPATWGDGPLPQDAHSVTIKHHVTVTGED